MSPFGTLGDFVTTGTGSDNTLLRIEALLKQILNSMTSNSINKADTAGEIKKALQIIQDHKNNRQLCGKDFLR